MPFSCSHTTHAQQPSTLTRFRCFAEKMHYVARKVHHTYKTLSDRYTPQSLNTGSRFELPGPKSRNPKPIHMGQTNPDRGSTQKVHQPIHTDKEQTFHRSRTKVRQGGNIFPLTCNVSHQHAAQSSRQAARVVVVSGGGGRDRTDDPLLAKQVLSQLSYAPSQDRQSIIDIHQ